MKSDQSAPGFERLLRARRRILATSAEEAAAGTHEWVTVVGEFKLLTKGARASALAEARRAVAEYDERAREAQIVLRALELSLEDTGAARGAEPVAIPPVQPSRRELGDTKRLIVDVMQTAPERIWSPREVREALEEAGHEFTKSNIESTMHRLVVIDGVLEAVHRGGYRLLPEEVM